MSLGAKIINCLTVIDAETITNHFSNPSKDLSNPTQLGSLANSTIYMVVATDEEIGGNACSELNIKAHQDDTIHWRATTLSANQDIVVNFSKFVKVSGDDVISTPTQVSGRDEWSATVRQVLNGARETYNWVFEICDPNDNNALYGYFQWDPYITVGS